MGAVVSEAGPCDLVQSDCGGLSLYIGVSGMWDPPSGAVP